MKKLVSILMLMALVMLGATSAMAESPSYWEDWDGRGTDSERCDYERDPDGWVHWVFSTKGESTSAELTLGGTGGGTYQPGEPLNAEVWHFYTPYFDLDGLTATIDLFGGDPGSGGGLVISDYCPGLNIEEITVTKTANTSFDREHDWSIEKKVETENGATLDDVPKIWLYTDGSGDETATWAVDVNYEDYKDSNFKVFGEIKVENTGNVPATVTIVSDRMETYDFSTNPRGVTHYNPVAVDCPELPRTLGAGEYLICTYSQDVDNAQPGRNFAAAFGHFGDDINNKFNKSTGPVDFEFGDPATETNKSVNIKDISDLFGEVALGTATAPNGASFNYDKGFAWDDYGRDDCGSFLYNNTATIVETEQSDSAALKVNVQCEIFAGETAWAANGDVPLQLRYTNRGNWATYVKYSGVEKTTTLFAGQTTPVGNVTFGAKVNGEVVITVNLTGDWEFEDVAENLKVQDYASTPSGNPSPGLFDHKEDCDASLDTCSITVPANKFYGVHVNVGQWVPDPNFGP